MIGKFVIGITLFLIFYYRDHTSLNNGSTTINFIQIKILH